MATIAGSRTTVNLKPDRDQIRDHLTDLYPGVDAGYLAIWTKADKRTTWRDITDLDACTETIQRLADAGHEVYTGVSLHPKPLGPESRGAADCVSVVPGL